MNCKKNASSNPGEEKQLFHPESEKVVEIGMERLRPFKNHSVSWASGKNGNSVLHYRRYKTDMQADWQELW